MDGWGWLEPRTTEELWARQFGGGFGGGDGDRDDDDDKGGRNSTSGRPWDRDGDGRPRFGGGPGSSFRFQAAKSIRTSTIILSVFNVIAAFATAVGILWDGYATAKRNNPKFSFRYEDTFLLLTNTLVGIYGGGRCQNDGRDHIPKSERGVGFGSSTRIKSAWS